MLDVESIGESAAYIAGENTYRELPMEWVLRQASRFPGLSVVSAREFPMRLSSHGLKNQIDYARTTAKKIEDKELRKAFLDRIGSLGKELRWWKDKVAGANYGIVLQKD